MNFLAIGSSDKTPFLLTKMQEDFATGFTLIDPTGSLAKRAANTIPPALTERTLYLDPSDIEHPVGFNILAGVAEDDRHTAAQDIRTFLNLTSPEGRDTLTRRRSNYVLRNALRLLLDVPGATLLGVPELLTNKVFRSRCLSFCTDRRVAAFWNHKFGDWKEADRQSAILDIEDKFDDLLGSPLLCNILGQQQSTFALDRGLLIIANLDRAKIGDTTAFLLGSLLISRAKGPLYINDLSFFASDYLATLLPQERFTLACRFLDELPRKLQQAVLAIPDKTVFATTREDAERLAFYVGVDNPTQLMAPQLDPDEARTSSGLTRPSAPPATPRLEAIRRRSRARYTRPRAKVERSLML